MCKQIKIIQINLVSSLKWENRDENHENNFRNNYTITFYFA
jgi:hypothetical protein